MPLYRSKPVEKEAFRYNLGPMKEEWPAWFHDARQDGTITINNGQHVIKTLEGEMVISEGDYVIRGLAGEIYPCKADIFHASYEAVVDDDPGDDPAWVVLSRINDLLLDLANGKPNDRSPLDRSWAIAQTDAEKLLAWWLYAAIDPDERAAAERASLGS